jgi:hypothetical protein
MLIKEMDWESSTALLTRVGLGRLACSLEGQPYITPMFWIPQANYLYSFSTQGQKINWMRQNPRVCVEFEEVVSSQDWATVIVFGRYEELPDTPEHNESRETAYHLLSERPEWWQPGYVRTELWNGDRDLEPLYLRIRIDEISGHRTVKQADASNSHRRRAAVSY